MRIEFKTKAQSTVAVAMMAAVTVVLSQLAVPMPSNVPVTLQTFAIALCAYMLGAKLGTAAVLVYVVLGAVGVPVFANFTGGLGIVMGPTGGFIIAFPVMALICGLSLGFSRKWLSIAAGVLSLAVCHLVGVLWFSVVTGTDFVASFLLASAPYLIKDVISVVLAYFVAALVKKQLVRARLAHSAEKLVENRND